MVENSLGADRTIVQIWNEVRDGNEPVSDDLPVISTIIPCFNQAHFLSAAIKTLQEQTFSRWEAIIVDDGSTDETHVIAKECQSQDPRVRVVRQSNQGLPAARNSGIRVARGEYIHLLDADDLLHPRAFEWLLEAVGTNERTLAVMGFAFFQNDPKVDLWTEGAEREYFPFVQQIVKNNLGTCHAYLAPRSMVIKLGGFDESIRAGEEDLWMRFAFHGCSLSVVPHIGAYYRRYDGSMSTDPIRAAGGWIQSHIRAYRWLKEGPDDLVRIDRDSRKQALAQVQLQLFRVLNRIALQLFCSGRFLEGRKLWRLVRQQFQVSDWCERKWLMRELIPLMPYMVLGRTTRLTQSQQREAAKICDLVKRSLFHAPLVPEWSTSQSADQLR